MKAYAGWFRGLFAGVVSAAVLTPLWLLTPPRCSAAWLGLSRWPVSSAWPGPGQDDDGRASAYSSSWAR